MRMTKLRIIGDVHCDLATYMFCAEQVKYSIQVGDLAFNYTLLGGLDSDHHKFIGGNHDHYPSILDGSISHALGDFGTHTIPGWKRREFFYVRGGYSIDRLSRKEGTDWFPEEQLNMVQCYDALYAYKRTKPKTMITHECPVEIIQFVGNPEWNVVPSRTAQLLQGMLEEHQPELWIFGHHHRKWSASVNGTTFICLPVMGYIDI